MFQKFGPNWAYTSPHSYDGTYFLTPLLKALDNYLSNNDDKNSYVLKQSKLKIIKSWPFIYWISDAFRNKFKSSLVKDVLKNCQGLATANNNRFLRFWWEINCEGTSDESTRNEKWVGYSKGGPFNKWYGNLWLLVNWENDGYEIKNLFDEKGKQKSRPQNEKFYFNEGVTYSASGSKGASYRFFPKNNLFDVGGSCIFPVGKYKNNYYILAFMNSKLSKYITDCLNPTVNIQVGDVERVPFIVPDEKYDNIISLLSQNNTDIKHYLCQTKIFERNFKYHPFILSIKRQNVHDLISLVKKFLNLENYLISQISINEAIINEKIFEIYGLSATDKDMVVAKEGESIGNLPVLPEAKTAYLNEDQATKEFPLDNIKDFIQNLPEKEFTPEEKNKITQGFPSLYQKNNDLEEFCIRNQVNPINVWF